MIHAYALWPHHWDHLAPIWHALKPELRGHAYVGHLRSTQLHVEKLGIAGHAGSPAPTDELILIASANELSGIRRAVLIEHGAGQSYQGVTHGAWPGGEGRENCVGFVVPRLEVAEANRARYPEAVEIVAGSPHVEALWALPPFIQPDPVVAFTGHWEASLCDEMRSAWAWHERAIRSQCTRFARTCVFHAHPRKADDVKVVARDLAVRFIPDLDALVEQAWVLVCDNSSVMYEWAALGRPVVVLNAPWYRRDVEHGLRFWQYADVGIQVDDPADLEAAIAVAIADPAPIRSRRTQVVQAVFAGGIRGAAARAARGIEELA